MDEEAESLTRRAAAYGAVSLTINGVVADEVKASCQQFGPNVTIVSDAPGRYRFKGYVAGGGLAPAIIGLAQEKGWHIADFEQEGGALDILFAASRGSTCLTSVRSSSESYPRTLLRLSPTSSFLCS